MNDDLKQIWNTLVTLVVACGIVVVVTLITTFGIKPAIAWFFGLF